MDKEIKCVDCGSMFFFTERDQEFYKMKEYKDPKRCIPCRGIKKTKFPNDVRKSSGPLTQGVPLGFEEGRHDDY